jgi:hypothetical protein
MTDKPKATAIALLSGGLDSTLAVKVLGYSGGFSTAPAVAADGYVYFLSDYDVLHRVT